MQKTKITFIISIFVAFMPINAAFSATIQPLRPFPQHTQYTAGTIKPNNVTQAQMDEAVEQKWDAWKTDYLKPAGVNKYYIKYNAKGDTVSEAHGYGMLLTVIMAGYDPNAQTYFDGLYQYYKEHPSQNNQYLMAWKQNKDFVDIEGADSATDGDMDIAYALLLADKQWGSTGPINYYIAATNIINAILQSDVNQNKGTLRLGDWATGGAYKTATRPSDFMLDHLKAFQAATGNVQWKNVIDKTYQVRGIIYRTYSLNIGLLPDFITTNATGAYVRAKPNFLEGPYDGNYYYNACRVPWRLTTDYLVTGDTRALTQLRQLNAWIMKKTNKNPANIRAGYMLNGTVIPGSNYSTAAFFAPFGVSAMITPTNQAWLNSIWTYTQNFPKEDYYEDSIRLFSMIVMSGNWWKP